MTEEQPSWVVQGEFGRVTINTTDQAIVEHAHRELNIIMKLAGADTAMIADECELPLVDDSIVLFNPWLPHAKLGSPNGQATVLSLFIDAAWLAARFPEYRTELPFARTIERVTPAIRECRDRLADAILGQIYDDSVRCELLLGDLVAAVMNSFGLRHDRQRSVSGGRPVDYRIRKALAYIQQHAIDNPSVEDIARNVGLSRSRFFEQFRRCVGVSPRQYIDSHRLGIATQWLTSNDGPLCDLADALGFGAHSNFTRFFTQHVALSPSQFRRQTISVGNRRDDAVASI